MMRPASVTLRLTLFFAIASTAVLLAVGYQVNAAVRAHFIELDRVELDGKLEQVRHALARANSQSDLDAIPQMLDEALVGHPGFSIAVVAPDGHVLFASSEPAVPASMLESTFRDHRKETLESSVLESGGHAFRYIVASAPTGIGGTRALPVAIAVNIDHQRSFLTALRDKLWLAILLGALFTVLLGWLAARRGLAPVHRLADVAQRISAKELGNRLSPDGVPAELQGLARAFNDMLTRLEESFRRLSDFSSDLAHEMRTPVSNLMTQTQVALARTRSAEEYREVLYSSLEEYERLARMISDMLFLAKADHDITVPRTETVDLALEIQDLFDFYGALAEERGVRLQLVGGATIAGERLMIRRAISNLLSNAIRHSPPRGSVRVIVDGQESGTVRLVVENTGERISAEHLPRLFDRFYRVDLARPRASDGAGLGLAITKSIVDAHGGEIRVTSTEQSTRFEITFPTPPLPDRSPSSPLQQHQPTRE